MQSCARFVRLRLFVAPVLLAVIASASPAVAQEVSGDFGVFQPLMRPGRKSPV